MSVSLGERRREFQVLVVDRDDQRRERILDWLTELGFGSVQIAAAPDSAASFADAQPPHIALVSMSSTAEAISEARQTAEKLRKVSREIQVVFYATDSASLAASRTLALQIASDATIWDIMELPFENDGAIHSHACKEALILTMDRVCSRLYYQFETEYWKNRWEKSAPKDGKDPVAVRDRLYACVQEFSKVRDLESVIKTAAHAFSRVIDGRTVIYFRWVPIRNSLVVSHLEAAPDQRAKGLGFSVSEMKVFKTPLEFKALREFTKDVFKADDYTTLLHGVPDDPTGLFVLLGSGISVGGKDEFEAIAFLFDLTWSRLEAVRDRHALERVDRGTGLPNKKAVAESMEFECVRARRLRHPFSAAAIEIGVGTNSDSAETDAPTSSLSTSRHSGFEAMLGPTHEAIMKIVGQTLRRALRGTDYVARVERSRFAVLMPHTSVAESVGVIDRMCRLIERLQLPALESAGIPRLRARAGVAEYPRLSSDADGLMQAMEDALTAAWSGLGTSGVRVMVHEVSPGFHADFEPQMPSQPTIPGTTNRT
ncbi:MAG: diguanylate cyclase [Deltaproteobacteria bacterium]|nr:diguanylate cyclase [Deltaproteobacteria bacterium]